MKALIALSLLLVGVSSASAQEKKSTPPPNLGLHLVIAIDAVQADLKLTDDQKKGIMEIATEARQALRGIRNLTPEERQKKTAETRQQVETKLEKLLKPEQMKRLQQIDLQQRGPLALVGKKIADEMQLTEEQRKAIREMSQNLTKEIAKLRQGGATGADLAEKLGKLRQDVGEKITKSLTEEQKKAWQKMVGEAFDLSKIVRQR